MRILIIVFIAFGLLSAAPADIVPSMFETHIISKAKPLMTKSNESTIKALQARYQGSQQKYTVKYHVGYRETDQCERYAYVYATVHERANNFVEMNLRRYTYISPKFIHFDCYGNQVTFDTKWGREPGEDGC